MTSYSYARGDEPSTMTGGVILVIASILSGVLVIAGLAYLAGHGPRHQRALAAAGCEPNLSPDPADAPCTTVWDLERQYTAMTTAALQQLNTDVADYTGTEFTNLAAAQTALTTEVTTAKAFATSLARFPFPPDVAAHARALIQAIDARIKLTVEQAKSGSLVQLRSFNPQIDALGTTIQTDLSVVHKILFTRPTAAQEPSA